MELIGKVVLDNSYLEDNLILFIKNDGYELISDEFIGYIFEDDILPHKLKQKLEKDKVQFITGINRSNIDSEDVVEINSSRNSYRILYRINSVENTILTTNQCNNNCIMCPDSNGIRCVRNNVDVNKLILTVSLMNKNTKFICITGGEPTLLKEQLFNLLDVCTSKLNKTEFIMLTNGRAFYYQEYTKEFLKHSPNNMIFGIPIHSHKEHVHDDITRANGSYMQTIKGINNLIECKQLVEIRIVINKFNYFDLNNIAEMICIQFNNCYRVNFMAMEILGNAYTNIDELWVDFQDFKKNLHKACITLLSNGIQTYIYNIPLCFVDAKLWNITKRSISENKISYGDECEECRVKERCGGFFFSTKKFKSLKGIGI